MHLCKRTHAHCGSSLGPVSRCVNRRSERAEERATQNMPLAQIDDKGTSIYYEDSGAPADPARYTTIVLVHGGIINMGIYERMPPYASEYGLRIITMNCRDYSGSTPYTAEELAELTSPDIEVQASAVRRWAHEIGQFLAYACQTLQIHRSVDGAGGLIVLTWSLMGMAALCMLGDPGALGHDLAAALSPYLRKVILHDIASFSYGYPVDIPGLSFPFTDPTIPHEKLLDVFFDWVSSHSAALPDGVPITAEALQKYSKILPGTPVLRTLSLEETQRIVEPEVSSRSMHVMGTDPSIHQRNSHRAFSDADAVLPNVELVAFWCDQSVWTTAWGAKVFLDLAQQPADPGKRKRKTSFVRIRGANHFVHWSHPEMMVRILAQQCNDTTAHATKFAASRL